MNFKFKLCIELANIAVKDKTAEFFLLFSL